MTEQYRWLDPLRLDAFFDGRQWWRLAYVRGRSPVGLTNGREQYLILADQVGTPVALASLDDAVVQTMRYDSFGNLLNVLGDAVRLPLGFAGGLYDADTGLTRFVWRDYDADTGRFTALDPLGEKGGDPDWYGYCVDDPVNRADAWGLEDDWIPQKAGNPEYDECMGNANWWKRQCKQVAELGGYIIGDKHPVRGWGIGEAGDWICDKTYEANADRCEEQYGSEKSDPDNYQLPDTRD